MTPQNFHIAKAALPLQEGMRVADVCLGKLTRAFLEHYPAAEIKPLTTELNDVALACLLIAAEWGGAGDTTRFALAECLERAANRFWGDRLVWELAIDLCRPHSLPMLSLDKLTANLDHQLSNMRTWMFDLGWCVRHKLNPVEAGVRLRKNVVDTLVGREASLGLYRSLFSSDEEFWHDADAFTPETLLSSIVPG